MCFMVLKFFMDCMGAVKVDTKGKNNNKGGSVDGTGKRRDHLPDVLLIVKN